MQKGFTLIETLIYIALFAIVIGGGMVAAYEIIQATDANRNQIILQEEANFVFRKIDWALTGATAITVSPSTLVTTKSISGTPTNLTFALDSTSHSITLKRNSNSANALNSTNFLATNLSFTDIPASGGSPHGVTTKFTLITVQNGRAASQDFSTTKYLRQ